MAVGQPHGSQRVRLGIPAATPMRHEAPGQPRRSKGRRPLPAMGGQIRTQEGRIHPRRPAHSQEEAAGAPRSSPMRAPAGTAAAGLGGATPKGGGRPPTTV